MHTWVLAALSFGIQLSSEVVSFISDEMSEKEQKKYQKMVDELQRLTEENEETVSRLKNKSDEEIKKYQEQELYSLEQERERLLAELQLAQEEKRLEIEDAIQKNKEEYEMKKNSVDGFLKQKETEFKREENRIKAKLSRELSDFITQKATERKEYVKSLIEEIKGHREKLKQFKQEHCSQLRKNAFELLTQELITAANKAYAYNQYLSGYIRVSESICATQEKDKLFSYTLPENYPYQGSILYLSEKDFDARTGKGRLYFHGEIQVSFQIEDISDTSDFKGEKIPVYVEEWHKEEVQGRYNKLYFKSYYRFSIQKGNYYLCKRSGGFSGIPAKVKSYERNNSVLLTYGKDMELILKPQNMLNAQHYPPIASEVIVYHMTESYHQQNQKMQYYVSQRVEDTEISLAFHEIPLVIPDSRMDIFIEYIQENNPNIEYDDAKIAPFQEHDTRYEKVRIQLQENFVMLVSIVHITVRNRKKQYFQFEEFLSSEQSIKVEEIFVPFHATIDVYDEEGLFYLARKRKMKIK